MTMMNKKVKTIAKALDDKRIAGKTVLDFGMYKGYTAKEVLKFNPQYLHWVHLNTDYKLTDKLFRKVSIAIVERNATYHEHRRGGGGTWDEIDYNYDDTFQWESIH